MSRKGPSSKEQNIFARLRNDKQSQNFSAILNSPEEPVSYFQGFKNMVYSTIYEENSSIDFDISKDIEKFSTIDIGSPRSLSSGHSNKISFKELLDENMDEYINSIKPEYDKYHHNHFSSRRSIEIKIPNERSHIYQTNMNILKIIDKEYLINEKDFMIKKDVLSQKREGILTNSAELIEKCGRIELELEKILEHSNKMSSYIYSNIVPFEKCANEAVISINRWKEMINVVRHNFLLNSTQLLLKGKKEATIKRIIIHLEMLKKLKEILELLKILVTNPKKYKIAFELIARGKDMIRKFKGKSNKKPIKLLNYFEDEFNKYSMKCGEQINVEFNTILCDTFKNFVIIIKDNDKDNSEENKENDNLNISKHVYEKISSSSQQNTMIMKNIKFLHIDIAKIKHLTQCFVQSDVIESLYQTLRLLISKVVIDNLSQAMNLIKAEINNEQNNSLSLGNNEGKITIIADVEKNEQILLLLSIQCKQHLTKMLKNIYATINDELNTIANNKQLNFLKENFQKDHNEIEQFNNKTCYQLIQGQVIKCLNEAIVHSNVDAFIDNFHLIKSIMNEEYKNELEGLYEKCECDSIQKWLNGKESKFKSPLYENWEDFKEIPYNYQKNLDYISQYQLSNNKDYQDYIREFQEKDSLSNSSDPLPYLIITEKKLKANQCSLDIVKATFEIIKMLTLYSAKTWNSIIVSYIVLLKRHIAYQKEFILDGMNSIISQTEISMTYSIIILIKQITRAILSNDKDKLIASFTTKETYYAFKEELLMTLDNMIHTSKCKILDLIDIHCIDKSLKELYMIKLPNYPLATGELTVNSYSLSLVSFTRTIYEAMVNAYDDTFIIKSVIDSLNKFFERFEKYIFNGEKIENEQSLKQFRRDMIFFKKNFDKLQLIDVSSIKLRIDNINKKVIPESMRKNTNVSKTDK